MNWTLKDLTTQLFFSYTNEFQTDLFDPWDSNKYNEWTWE